MMTADVRTTMHDDGFKVRVTFFQDGRVLATYGCLAESEDAAQDAAGEARGHLRSLGIEEGEA